MTLEGIAFCVRWFKHFVYLPVGWGWLDHMFMAGPYVFRSYTYALSDDSACCQQSEIYFDLNCRCSLLHSIAPCQRFSCTVLYMLHVQNELIWCFLMHFACANLFHNILYMHFLHVCNANVIVSMQVCLRLSPPLLGGELLAARESSCSCMGPHVSLVASLQPQRVDSLRSRFPNTMAAPKQTHSTAIVPDVSKISLVTRPGSWLFSFVSICFLRWKLGARVLKIWWSVYLSHLHRPGLTTPWKGLV